MSIEQYILVGAFILASIGAIMSIGKVKEPTTPLTAVIAVTINLICAYLVVRL